MYRYIQQQLFGGGLFFFPNTVANTAAVYPRGYVLNVGRLSWELVFDLYFFFYRGRVSRLSMDDERVDHLAECLALFFLLGTRLF